MNNPDITSVVIDYLKQKSDIQPEQLQINAPMPQHEQPVSKGIFNADRDMGEYSI